MMEPGVQPGPRCCHTAAPLRSRHVTSLRGGLATRVRAIQDSGGPRDPGAKIPPAPELFGHQLARRPRCKAFFEFGSIEGNHIVDIECDRLRRSAEWAGKVP